MVRARDRIIALSDENAGLKAERDALVQQRDEARKRAGLNTCNSPKTCISDACREWRIQSGMLSPERTAELIKAGKAEGELK